MLYCLNVTYHLLYLSGFEDFVDDGADDEAIFCDELAGEQSRFFHSPSVGAQLPGGGQVGNHGDHQGSTIMGTINPLRAKFFGGNIKLIFTFYVITPHWYDTCT